MTTHATFPGDPFPIYRQTDNNRKELKKEKDKWENPILTAFKSAGKKASWGTRKRT